VFAIVWDFLWFVLNPAFGIRRFRRREARWYRRWLGPAPIDYWVAIGVSIALAAVTAAGSSLELLWRHLGLLGGMAVLTTAAVALAPHYHRWYRRMRA
jgi:hypothetical protein